MISVITTAAVRLSTDVFLSFLGPYTVFVVRSSVLGAGVQGSIPERVVPKTLKMAVTASYLAPRVAGTALRLIHRCQDKLYR